MSSITTSLINTANGTTSLGLGTGNTSGPSITINTANQITLKANSSVNTAIANTTGFTTNVPLNVNGSITVSNVAIVSYNGSNAVFGAGAGEGLELRANNQNSITVSSSGDITAAGNTSFNKSVSVNNNISAANLTVSSNSFTLGSSSISPNGYTTLPNGLKLMWGTASVTTASTTVTFPTPFSSVVYSVTLTGTVDSSDVRLLSSNTTTFRADVDFNCTVNYMAIGV